MILEMFGMRLATFTDLANELDVKTNQVFMWSQRRERNGFPEPVLRRPAKNGLVAPWFDVEEVLEWRAHYVPAKGGYHKHKPKGVS